MAGPLQEEAVIEMPPETAHCLEKPLRGPLVQEIASSAAPSSPQVHTDMVNQVVTVSDPTKAHIPEKANLATLPRELLIEILEYSHDLDSLLSTIASCRAFNQAFHVCPGPLLGIAVSRSIDPAVLPEAMLALKAASLRRDSPPKANPHHLVSQLVEENRESLLRYYNWNIADALSATRLHSVVESFASEFSRYYLFWLQKNSRRDVEAPPSEDELSRIKRALYWFETFCKVLPCPERDLDDEYVAASVPLLSALSPWEREQLVSIYESLWRVVTPVFNDLALHDVEWCSSHINYVDEPSDACTAAILSRGLLSIRGVGLAETYARRHELLFFKDLPEVAYMFLEKSFDYYNESQWNAMNSASSGSDPQRLLEQFYDDPDTGPETIWSKARCIEDWSILPKESANSSDYRSERACGYVFWDKQRLQGTGWFDRDWDDYDPDDLIEVEEEIEINSPSLEEVYHSRKVRKELRSYGFKGYWEEGGVLDLELTKIRREIIERQTTCVSNGRQNPPPTWTYRDTTSCAIFKHCLYCQIKYHSRERLSQDAGWPRKAKAKAES